MMAVKHRVMMRLLPSRYTIVFIVQMLLLTGDLIFNTFSNHIRHNNGILLLTFVLQDFLQLFCIVLLLISFFQTSVFQAGFLSILYKKFWLVLSLASLYLIVSIILHAWILFTRWSVDIPPKWSTPLYSCFLLQRILCPMHYYVYKRTALRISDQRFYEDDWLNDEMRQNMR